MGNFDFAFDTDSLLCHKHPPPLPQQTNKNLSLTAWPTELRDHLKPQAWGASFTRILVVRQGVGTLWIHYCKSTIKHLLAWVLRITALGDYTSNWTIETYSVYFKTMYQKQYKFTILNGDKKSQTANLILWRKLSYLAELRGPSVQLFLWLSTSTYFFFRPTKGGL